MPIRRPFLTLAAGALAMTGLLAAAPAGAALPADGAEARPAGTAAAVQRTPGPAARAVDLAGGYGYSRGYPRSRAYGRGFRQGYREGFRDGRRFERRSYRDHYYDGRYLAPRHKVRPRPGYRYHDPYDRWDRRDFRHRGPDARVIIRGPDFGFGFVVD